MRPHEQFEAVYQMAVAVLSMYTEPAAVRKAYEELIHELARRLDVQLVQPPPADLRSLWLHPQLLLAQTCGYPWATVLHGKVKLVCSPRYTLPGCEEATHCSFILVPESSSATSLADLRGMRAAINSQDSNSGMNLFRHAIAPLAKDGRFFGQVIESGSHAGSIAMLKEDLADAAAVDAVTFGYLLRDDPGRVAGLRVLAQTVQSPTLPFITAVSRSDEEVQRLREVLRSILIERADLAQTVAIEGFDIAHESRHMSVLDWQQQAIQQGYPTLE